MRIRKTILRKKIEEELKTEKPSIDKIINYIDEYEVANLETIKKLKRKRKLEFRKINGAIKQTINAHGPITKDFIGSATKRIYGSLLEEKKENKFLNFLRWILGKR
jgi:hypothetical protein